MSAKTDATGDQMPAISDSARVTVNGKRYPLRADLTVIEFLADIDLGKRQVIVERNGEPLPTEQLATTRVVAGDRYEVAQLVGGG